jgi:hypothetical protein
MHKMTIQFYVLSTLMENLICCNVKLRLIIIENQSRLRMRKLKILKQSNHVISQVTAAMDWYSASAEDLETVCCFFDFQEIIESPMKTQKPVTERRVSGHAAQFESQKAFNFREELE